MTRKRWMLLAAALLCALSAFYWPMNLGKAVPLETENYVVTWIESSIVGDGLSARPQQSTKTYNLHGSSPEGKELAGILSSYSYHRCGRTLWGGGSIDGKGGLGGTLLLSGGGETLILPGTGEILLGGTVYRTDYMGRKNSMALGGEILKLLAGCTPAETSP